MDGADYESGGAGGGDGYDGEGQVCCYKKEKKEIKVTKCDEENGDKVKDMKHCKDTAAAEKEALKEEEAEAEAEKKAEEEKEEAERNKVCCKKKGSPTQYKVFPTKCPNEYKKAKTAQCKEQSTEK